MRENENPSAPAGGPELTPNQVRAIESLLAGSTMTEAAEAAGVDRSTLYRWRHSDPDFIAGYNRLRQEQNQNTMARLMLLQPKAIETLEAIMDNPDAPGRLGAVKFILQVTGALDSDRIGAINRDLVEAELQELERMSQLGWRVPEPKN